VNLSMWDLFGTRDSLGGTNIGAAELVINPQKGNVTELMIGPSGPGPFLRSKSTAAGDIDLYTDGEEGGLDGRAGISWDYRGCALPKVFREPMQYIAVYTRIRGNGTLNATVSTLDHKYTQALTPI